MILLMLLIPLIAIGILIINNSIGRRANRKEFFRMTEHMEVPLSKDSRESLERGL